eukprot:TRINITY_DN20629_c0_g1_i5.p1 TRINITY_DN20629_c0_g1~~TRINITY_DN20629_c0_g1_i5.p1  ORF type:complete len:137 (-),score=40.25 TRINITY_DN20629_c0_g1_i5:52-462(-)
MGATRRHRNQALNQAKLDKLNEAADEQQRQLDPEGMSRARDKIHTFTRRTDDLTANWARFLVFSSGFLAVVICSSLVSRTDMSFKALSLIHISEPTRLLSISYAVFCLKKKKKKILIRDKEWINDSYEKMEKIKSY